MERRKRICDGAINPGARRLFHARAGSSIVNASYPGARTADLFAQLQRSPHRGIAAVLVVAGANDIRRLTTPLAFARQQRDLLERVHRQYPKAPVFMTNVPDVSGRYFSLRTMSRRTQAFAPLRIPLRWLIDIDDGVQQKLAREFGATLIDLHARIAAYMWPILANGILSTRGIAATPVCTGSVVR